MDFWNSTDKELIPNLEIMKLASYYVNEEREFCRLLSPTDTNLDAYSKIYIFSEAEEPPEIPAQYKNYDIILGGSAFTNQEYQPFENQLIDFSLPRKDIYAEALKQKLNDNVNEKVISRFLDMTCYRNYAGEQKLPLPAVHKRRRVMLYDRDFFYEDWEQTIESISSHSPSSITRIHPIICKRVTDFFRLRSYSLVSHSIPIILDLNIPSTEINYMIEKYKTHFLANISRTTNISLWLGGDFEENFQYFQDFIYKMNLLYSFWSAGIMMKLKFKESHPSYSNPIVDLEREAAQWTNRFYNRQRTQRLDDKILYKSKKTPAMMERELLVKTFPACQNLFLQSFDQLKERGVWCYVY